MRSIVKHAVRPAVAVSALMVIGAGFMPVVADNRPSIDPPIVTVTAPAESTFRSGVLTRARIGAAARPVIAVPEQAVVWQDGKPAVFVVDRRNRVVVANVLTGTRHAGLVSIESGISHADRIVVAGEGLSEGRLVRIQSDAFPGNKGPAR